MPDFGPDVVAAVTHHMNADHGADNVVICRALGGVPSAESAVMTGLDNDGIDFLVDDSVSVRIPWSRRLEERPEIRAEVTRMYHEARELLGS